MSYFQPILTTAAFSSFATSRAAYANSTQDVTENNDASAIGQATGTIDPQATQGVQQVTQSSETQNESSDRDSGKPKSASGDVLDLSDEAQKSYDAQANAKVAGEDTERNDGRSDSAAETDTSISLESEEQDSQSAATTLNSSESELTEEEQSQVKELEARDAEVRLHEQQHVSAGGQYVTGGPSYTYQTGPDGKKYAIGGEVSIDISPVEGDPEATIRKMQTVAAAAMAPAEPSSQDHKVAASARQAEAQARAELSQETFGETKESSEASSEDTETQAVGTAMQSEESTAIGNDTDDSASSKSASSSTSISVESSSQTSSASQLTSSLTNSASANSASTASAYRMVSAGQLTSSGFSAYA